MKKIVIVALGALFIAVVSYGLKVKVFSQNEESPVSNNKIKVVASFYPLAYFAEAIGKDKIEVTNVTPPGSEPHDFEPTPQDLVNLQKSKVFIYNGAGFEPWVNKVLPELREQILVDSSKGINLLQSTDEEEKGNDPHVWLDPNLASIQIQNITDGLAKADPANRNFYEANAAHYKDELTKLDEELAQGLSACERRDIVVSHSAYNYLGKHYNLNVIAISGISPDEEPSPQKLAEIARFAREKNIKYIFFETLISDQLSQTVAREIGAQTLVLNPIEGLTPEEINQGKNYLSVQRDNLKNLRLAMNCQ